MSREERAQGERCREVQPSPDLAVGETREEKRIVGMKLKGLVEAALGAEVVAGGKLLLAGADKLVDARPVAGAEVGDRLAVLEDLACVVTLGSFGDGASVGRFGRPVVGSISGSSTLRRASRVVLPLIASRSRVSSLRARSIALGFASIRTLGSSP
jgi:hypothetical protein